MMSKHFRKAGNWIGTHPNSRIWKREEALRSISRETSP